MTAGFYRLVVAQFVSGLADHSLLIIALAFLYEQGYPLWWAPLLKIAFTLSYVVLAPLVGEIADVMPKQRLMLWTQFVKWLGIAGFMMGVHPLLAFAIVGAGSATYNPAKYGWVIERSKPGDLVKANGWLEITMVFAALLGTAAGGWLVSGYWAWDRPSWLSWLIAPTDLTLAFGFLLLAYSVSWLLTLSIPHSPARKKWKGVGLASISEQFVRGNMVLWRDPLGGLSLGVTVMIWGAAVVMQLAVLQWSVTVLNLGLDQAAYLQTVVAVGIVIGAFWVIPRVSLRKSAGLWPLGVAMGAVVFGAAQVTTWPWAVPTMLLVGALGGALVVPMNALLQYRGNRLLRPGLSISVQGFNENIGILLMLAIYTALLSEDFSIVLIMCGFGLLLVTVMGLLGLRIRSIRARNIGVSPGVRAKGSPFAS
jgi:MFS family permease